MRLTEYSIIVESGYKGAYCNHAFSKENPQRSQTGSPGEEFFLVRAPNLHLVGARCFLSECVAVANLCITHKSGQVHWSRAITERQIKQDELYVRNPI